MANVPDDAVIDGDGHVIEDGPSDRMKAALRSTVAGVALPG